MIGMLVLSHGQLAQEFVATLEHILGPQENIKAIGIGPNDDIEEKRYQLIREINAVNTGKGVVIFTDMFGGTPSNLAISSMQEKTIEIVAGVNLPMLVKFASVRGSMSLVDAIVVAEDAGKNYINVASKLLASKTKA
ncbi:MAG: PTS sugar transporter subunit IIA [Alphaproteobacteria bacterium]|nr:PTS sugar transporter subunit IIA [Alphaproteobacteria bacterium]